MNLIEKIEHVLGLYLKRSTQSYILSKKEYDAFMKGIRSSYKIEITDAFNSGREMERGRYKFKNVNEFIRNKNKKHPDLG